MRAVHSYAMMIPARAVRSVLLLLSRGKNEPGALEEFAAGAREALALLARQLADDDAFWAGLPHARR